MPDNTRRITLAPDESVAAQRFEERWGMFPTSIEVASWYLGDD